MDLQTGVHIPRLWWQGRKIRQRIPRLQTPADPPTGAFSGNDPSLHLLGLGESPVACYGLDAHADGVTARLAHRIHQETARTVTWHAHGVVGITIDELAAAPLPATRPDLIFVAMGVNDTKNLVRRDRWRQGWRRLLGSLQQRYDVPIIVSEVPPLERFPALPPWMAAVLGRRGRLLQAVLDEETARHGAIPAPLFGRLSPDMFAADAFHPGVPAHQAWADAVWPAVAGVLA